MNENSKKWVLEDSISFGGYSVSLYSTNTKPTQYRVEEIDSVVNNITDSFESSSLKEASSTYKAWKEQAKKKEEALNECKDYREKAHVKERKHHHAHW